MNELDMKQKILDILKELMMTDSGKKFKPAEVQVEVVSLEPKEEHDKPSLEEALDAAQEDNPVEDEDEEDYRPKGLRKFLGR